MKVVVNRYNLEVNDKVYNTDCCIHCCGICNFVLMDKLKHPKAKENCFRFDDSNSIKLNNYNLFNY